MKHEHECKWALKLQVYYPCGLNEEGSGGINNPNIDKVAVRKIFSPFARATIRL